MSLLPSTPMAFHCTENKQARAQALMMCYGTCPDGCVYLGPVSSSLLLGSRLLSQVSTHWSIGLGLSSVTFPQLVPVILQISAKHHILRTSSLPFLEAPFIPFLLFSTTLFFSLPGILLTITSNYLLYIFTYLFPVFLPGI